MEFIIFFAIIIALVIFLFTQSSLYVKRNGKKTLGKIMNVDRRSYVDQYGVTHTTYYISYSFVDSRGRQWSGQKRATYSPGKPGSDVVVYYLPQNPRRSMVEL